MTPSTLSDTPLLPVAFRDTALTVTTLSHGAMPPSFDALCQHCQEQVQRLRDELKAGGHADDVVEDALYAQCALLDEAALSHLKDADRDAWEREPLQVSTFQTHHAGEELIARMEQRVLQPQPVRPLLAIFLAVLSLGFRGRFALEGREARTSLMKALNDRLGVAGGSSEGVIVRAGRSRSWLAPLSLPASVLLTAVAAAIVYVLIDRWLSASVTHLLP